MQIRITNHNSIQLRACTPGNASVPSSSIPRSLQGPLAASSIGRTARRRIRARSLGGFCVRGALRLGSSLATSRRLKGFKSGWLGLGFRQHSAPEFCILLFYRDVPRPRAEAERGLAWLNFVVFVASLRLGSVGCGAPGWRRVDAGLFQIVGWRARSAW